MNTQKLSQLLCHLEWLDFMRIGVQQFLERGYFKVSHNRYTIHQITAGNLGLNDICIVVFSHAENIPQSDTTKCG